MIRLEAAMPTSRFVAADRRARALVSALAAPPARGPAGEGAVAGAGA